MDSRWHAETYEMIVLLDPMPWATFRDQREVASSPDRNPGYVVTLSKEGQNLQGSLAESQHVWLTHHGHDYGLGHVLALDPHLDGENTQHPRKVYNLCVGLEGHPK